MTHTSSAMNIGRAMRAFAGIWMSGSRPIRFRPRMNENSVSRNGVNGKTLRAHGLQDDLVLDELDGHLADVLHAGRHERALAGEHEEADGDDRRRARNSSTILLTANARRRPRSLGQLKRCWYRRDFQREQSCVSSSRLETGVGERDRKVAGLPEQQAEVGHDDGEAEGHLARPS